MNSKAQELRPTDVEAVMAAVERSLAVQLAGAGATLTYDPMPAVMADPLQLEQVFSNLVSNAIKFRREGAPLAIEVSADRIDGGMVEFSVKDNGIGIGRVLRPDLRDLPAPPYQGRLSRHRHRPSPS